MKGLREKGKEEKEKGQEGGRRAVRLIEEARWVIAKLERLSADSVWAHRASGARGGLLRMVEGMEAGGDGGNGNAPGEDELGRLEQLIEVGYEMLENAARELGEGG